MCASSEGSDVFGASLLVDHGEKNQNLVRWHTYSASTLGHRNVLIFFVNLVLLRLMFFFLS